MALKDLKDIIRQNHPPLFLWLGVLFLVGGAILYTLSYIEGFAYLVALSGIFLTRYIMDIHFFERLNKEHPLLYFILWSVDIYFFAVWLPQTIIEYMHTGS